LRYCSTNRRNELPKHLKILWWAVCRRPIPSAYAEVTSALVNELRARGHRVDLLSMLPQTWASVDHPGGIDFAYPYDEVVPQIVLQHWFKAHESGEPYDLCVFMGDLWANGSSIDMLTKAGYLDAKGQRHTVKLLVHAPIDHEPLTPQEVGILDSCVGMAVPTRWGADVVSAGTSDLPVGYVPHGVDTQNFSPPRSNQKEVRKMLGWPEDATIFGCVASNKGSRKNLGNLMRAFSMAKPSALLNGERLLALHSYPFADVSNPSGFALDQLAVSLGIMDRVILAAPDKIKAGLSAGEMALFYQALDYYVQPSKTEGFGIPLLEAAATGLRMAVSDIPPMREVAPAGATHIEVIDKEVQQLMGSAWWWQPSTKALTRWFKLAGARPRPLKPDHDSIKHAQGYSWPAAGDLLEDFCLQLSRTPTTTG